jgi:hypothetical protein
MQTYDGSVILNQSCEKKQRMRHHSVEVVSKSGIDRKAQFAKICIPRTSRLISSYSPPASLHLRYSALQNETTISTSDGDVPKLISLFGLPLSFLEVDGNLEPHSPHVMR